MTTETPPVEGWTAGPLPGVWRRSILAHPDSRGSFSELWRASWSDRLDAGAGDGRMRQANLSRSQPRVLRGLHMHRHQADLWLVVDGHPLIGLVDVRPALTGGGKPRAVTIDAGPGDAVYLPAGVAHGFYARDAMTLIYLVTNEYNGSDELGFRWDDADAAVPWPDREPILSPRDATAPSLAELIESLTGSTAR
jgi:dTDP-4-dehydrorhamnose 3,5-epimerase